MRGFLADYASPSLQWPAHDPTLAARGAVDELWQQDFYSDCKYLNTNTINVGERTLLPRTFLRAISLLELVFRGALISRVFTSAHCALTQRADTNLPTTNQSAGRGWGDYQFTQTRPLWTITGEQTNWLSSVLIINLLFESLLMRKRHIFSDFSF